MRVYHLPKLSVYINNNKINNNIFILNNILFLLDQSFHLYNIY